MGCSSSAANQSQSHSGPQLISEPAAGRAPPASSGSAPVAPKPTTVVSTASSLSPPPSSGPEVEGEVNFKPIHSAIRWKKPVSEVMPLITGRAAANARDTGNGNCPLHIAAQNGHLELVNLLISKGGDVNSQNGKGNTALHMALSYDYVDVARALINAGASLDLENGTGIPARRGLEGDKCLPVVLLGLAETTQSALDALQLCDQNLQDLDKASFISTCLKTKKALGDQWTDPVQAKFREVSNKL